MGMTVGQAALSARNYDIQADYHELQKEILQKGRKGENFESNLWEAVERGRKDPSLKGNFYIVVLLRKETTLQNVVRLQYLYRQSCPSPGYDQTVFKYDRQGDFLDFIWSIPNNVTTIQMLTYPQTFPEDQKELIEFAKAFSNGELEKLAKTLNKEVENE